VRHAHGFETHFVTKDYVRAVEENNGYPRYIINKQTGSRRLYYTDDVGEPLGDTLLNRLFDTGEERLKDVDAAGIDVQVLSIQGPRSYPAKLRLKTDRSTGVMLCSLRLLRMIDKILTQMRQ
jgi:hypothetical protein